MPVLSALSEECLEASHFDVIDKHSFESSEKCGVFFPLPSAELHLSFFDLAEKTVIKGLVALCP